DEPSAVRVRSGRSAELFADPAGDGGMEAAQRHRTAELIRPGRRYPARHMADTSRAIVVVCLAAIVGCAPARDVWTKIRPSSGTPEAAPAPAPAAKTGGTLLLSGGTRTAGALIAGAGRLMAGSSARVLVVPVAPPRGDGGKADVDTWRRAGFADVETLDAGDAAHAAAQIDDATFIWMTGVDSSRLIEQLVASGAS